MLYPPVNELVKRTGTRYALVVTAAKRARQLIEGDQPQVNIDSNKAITIAANEYYEDKYTMVPMTEDELRQQKIRKETIEE